MEKPKLKLSKYKMTPEELQYQLKVRNQGGGVTKNKKAYTRKKKHRKADY